ncbi:MULTISPECIES: PucR family transcriptional regulator [Streptomyces]|uniref:Transcriptional regulator n=1 Tax=Streptomyces canarius TaxID=285453 RepID=A0ABQ3D8Z0_9ACTN|nr:MULTISPECIES: helix-turn-helix domain-containing protein [Streptomyces]GGY80072.1 transcriptional regulator [Streptomyces olivaceoviridis]GHA65269.1 transcriptional regulator [Streptomyces canarius]
MAERRLRVRVGSDALQELIEELAERLERSVVVDDPLVRLICSSQHFGDEDPVRIRSLLRGRADDVAIRYVLDQGVARWTKPGFIPGRDDLGLLTRYCVPLRERGELLGLLMVVAPEGTLTREETDRVAQAVPAISAQLRADQLAASADEVDLHETLHSLFGTGEAARAAARRQILDGGVLPDAPHAVVSVVQVSRSVEPPGQVEIALRASLERFLRTRSADGAMAATPDGAVLLQVSARPLTAQELADQATAVREALAAYLEASAAPVLGIGGTQDGLADAWTSHAQALVASRAARRLPHLKGVGAWESLGELAVLLQVPDHALTPSLVPTPLHRLLDSPGGQRLVDTLRCFLEHAGSIPRTAEALQIHRTSLYYRLRQIQEITGLDLDSGGDRLVLHLGLRTLELLQAETDVQAAV